MMWPFKKKIVRYCSNCGNKIKIPESKVCTKQTKYGITMALSEEIYCKHCGNQLKLPIVRIKNDGTINVGGKTLNFEL